MSCERSLRSERAASGDANDSATRIATTTTMLTTLELNKIASATSSYLNMLENLFISPLIVPKIMRSPIINIWPLKTENVATSNVYSPSYLSTYLRCRLLRRRERRTTSSLSFEEEREGGDESISRCRAFKVASIAFSPLFSSFENLSYCKKPVS